MDLVYFRHLAHLATEYGYASLALLVFLESLGLPIPAEVVLLTLTLLVRKHQVVLGFAVVVASVANVLGALVPYGIGRWGERKLANRFLHISPERHEHLRDRMATYGALTLVVTRITGILRHASLILAGLADMPLPIIVISSFIGSVLWLYFGFNVVRYTGITLRHLEAGLHRRWLDLLGIGILLVALGLTIVYLNRAADNKGRSRD